MSDDVKLTAKQQRFVDVFDGNAIKAAIAAGYSVKTAASIGAENLKKPQIIKAIKNREKQVVKPAVLDRNERQRFWTRIIKDETEEMKNWLRASELLGKSEGDFIERLRHEGELGIIVQVVSYAGISGE